MIFDTELERGRADGPSLILLHQIPGRGDANIICAECSDDDDYPVVLEVAMQLGVDVFTTNVERD